MKHLLLFILACHFLSVSFAQTSADQKFIWVKTINYSFADSGLEMFDFCADATGNTYIYGTFFGKITFVGSATILQADDAYEAYFVAKYAPDGVLQWARKIVTPNGEAIFSYTDPSPCGISADNSGNVYISGQLSNASLSFGDVVLQRSCTGTPTCSDIFIAKYNAAGMVEWVRQASGTAGTTQRAVRLVTGTDSTIFLAGNYEGNRLVFDGDLSYPGLSPNGMYIARYNSDGTAMSASFFDNGTNYAQLEHLAITNQNEVLATGYYAGGGLEFGNDVNLDLYGDNGAVNYFIVRYNAQGQAQQAYNLHSSYYVDLLDLAADTAGQPYLVVDFATDLNSGTELIANTAVAEDSTAILLHLADSTFHPVLTVEYYGPTYPLANVTVDRHDRFFVGGHFADEELVVADTVLTNKGCDDALLLSGSSDTSALAWIRSAGGIGCEAILSLFAGRTLATDSDGYLYVAGSFGIRMQLDNFLKTGDGLFIGKLRTPATVGINDPWAANLDFSVSPNPSQGDFHITAEEVSGPSQVTVYDAQGSVRYQRLAQQTMDLEVRLQLPSGLYTVVLQNKNKIGRQKMLIINDF